MSGLTLDLTVNVGVSQPDGQEAGGDEAPHAGLTGGEGAPGLHHLVVVSPHDVHPGVAGGARAGEVGQHVLHQLVRLCDLDSLREEVDFDRYVLLQQYFTVFLWLLDIEIHCQSTVAIHI